MKNPNLYVITPASSENIGWYFKEADSDFVIKHDDSKSALEYYAKSFTNSLNADLIIFNEKGHIEDIIKFKNSGFKSLPIIPILSGILIFASLFLLFKAK